MRMTYSEGYERKPRLYPWLRTKDDRLDSTGLLIGPYDQMELELPRGEVVIYEPFWFRAFHLIRLEIETVKNGAELVAVKATQVNYPFHVKAEWENESDIDSDKILDVSVRTMRNCMLDGYSDCPFYEQLQ